MLWQAAYAQSQPTPSTTLQPGPTITALDLGIRLGKLEAEVGALKQGQADIRDDINGIRDDIKDLERLVWGAAGGLGLLIVLMPLAVTFMPSRSRNCGVPSLPTPSGAKE